MPEGHQFNSFPIWQEHLIDLNNKGLEDTSKPLLGKDQITISRLEKQAEEFLNAVLCRKGESQRFSSEWVNQCFSLLLHQKHVIHPLIGFSVNVCVCVHSHCFCS